MDVTLGNVVDLNADGGGGRVELNELVDLGVGKRGLVDDLEDGDRFELEGTSSSRLEVVNAGDCEN